MPWLELSLSIDVAQRPAMEATLEALGAQALTLLDADAETCQERAIFQLDAGQTPL